MANRTRSTRQTASRPSAARQPAPRPSAEAEGCATAILDWALLIGVVLALGIIFFAAVVFIVQWISIGAATPPPVAGETAILQRADDAARYAQSLLSFLEAAAVFIVVAAGLGVVYTMRRARNQRDELNTLFDLRERYLDRKLSDIDNAGHLIRQQLRELEQYRPHLQVISTLQQNLEISQEGLEQAIGDVARLLQAEQEFRLGNYATAHEYALDVLAHTPDNPMALYIAGWIEVEQWQDALDTGLDRLATLAAQQPGWATALAAHGVGLRRKAWTAAENARESLHLQAESQLKAALAKHPELLDFRGESFWCAVGDIAREAKRYEEAITAYEKAAHVTPGSATPQAALGLLYLRKAQNSPDGGASKWQSRALYRFQETVKLGSAEMSARPTDFYLLNDIARATIMLGQRKASLFRPAQQKLDEALTLNGTSHGSLATIRRDWQDLHQVCPTNWYDVRVELENALAKIDAAIGR